MGGFQLPNPFAANPQIQAGGAPNGGVIPANSSATAGMLANQQNIQQGVSQLMTGLVAVTQGVQQHFRQKYDDAISMIANGTLPNPDYKQIASWGKKGGIPMQSEMTPADLQAHQAVAQQKQMAQQMQALAQTGAPGMPGVAAAAGDFAATPPTQAPQAAPPGFIQRMKNAVGMGGAQQPQFSMDSPMGQYLQQLNSAAQSQGGAPAALGRGQEMSVIQGNVQKAMAKLGITQTAGLEPLMKQALAKASDGDQDALMMLQRMNVFKSVPIDEVGELYKAEFPQLTPAQANAKAAQLLLWQQGGGPVLQAKMADFTKELLPRFGGDLEKASAYVSGLYNGQPVPGLKPGMDPKEFTEYTDATKKIMDRYPTAPAGLAHLYGQSMVNGKPELGNNILDFLQAHYKGAQDIASSQFQSTLSKDYAQISSIHDIGQQDADSQKLRVYTDALEKMTGPTKTIIEHPKDYTAQQVQGAYKDWIDNTNGLASQKLKINGREVPLGHLNELLINYNILPGMQGSMHGTPRLEPRKVPDAALQQMMGGHVPPPPVGTHQAPAATADMLRQLLQGGGQPSMNPQLTNLLGAGR